jgi:hypothetical protein
MTANELHSAPLWSWIRERGRIRIRKERGDAPPWTDAQILQKYRFCCVRREDDRGTIWIRRNIREPYADHPMLWLMLCIARQINWLDTLEELIRRPGAWPIYDAFDPAEMTKVMNDRKARGEKIYTGAYMIPAPALRGSDKQSHIAERVIGDLWRRRHEISTSSDTWHSRSLQDVHQAIAKSSGWGPFLAYQAVVDIRFTKLLELAPDRETWAAAGPGTIRGLNRLHGRPVDRWAGPSGWHERCP